MDENLTPDEFYCGPLRGILSKLGRCHVLRNVQTLILDGLSVPADLVQEIISEDRFNVKILSIREAGHLNERKLQQVLLYAVRPTRPEGSPRLKGLYLFGPRDAQLPTENPKATRQHNSQVEDNASSGVMSTEGAQIGATWNQKYGQAPNKPTTRVENPWYRPTGKMIKRRLDPGWGATLKACEGIIAFDAVLCRGPRHDLPTGIRHGPEDCSPSDLWLQPAVATIALGPSGCGKCGSSPELPAFFSESPSRHLPLLSPPPLHSSSVRTAQRPVVISGSLRVPFYARCGECLQGRWCERCQVWWDEGCYAGPVIGNRLLEVRAENPSPDTLSTHAQSSIKVHMGLCTEHCLVGEMMSGAGSFGMWG